MTTELPTTDEEMDAELAKRGLAQPNVEPANAAVDEQLADALRASVTGDLRADVTSWLRDHPDYTRERYLSERNEAIRQRQKAELDARDAKEGGLKRECRNGILAAM